MWCKIQPHVRGVISPSTYAHRNALSIRVIGSCVRKWRGKLTSVLEIEIALLSHVKLELNPRFLWLVESLVSASGLRKESPGTTRFVDSYLGLSRLTKVSCVLVFKDNLSTYLSIYVNFFVISARVKKERERKRERERERLLFSFLFYNIRASQRGTVSRVRH